MTAFASAKRKIAAALAAPLVVLGLASPAAAATVTETPTTSWTPWKACASGTANCALVRSVVSLPGDRVAIAGNFTQLRSADGQSVAVGNLAVIQKSTGQLDPDFAGHTWNGTVFDLETDGSFLYAVGAFTKVDGKAVSRVARFDAATGARTAFKANVNGVVHASELHGGKLWIGGNFTGVQGQTRNRLAALDAGTGTVDPTWTPSVAMTPSDTGANKAAHNTFNVRDIAVNRDVSRVYVAGDFDVVNGVTNVSTITALDTQAGAVAEGWTTSSEFRTDWGFQGMSIALVEGDDPGILLAGGGTTNRSWRLGLDGSVKWRVHGDGDFQAVAVSDGTVYLGGHFVCVSALSCYDKNSDGTPNRTGDASRLTVAAFPYSPTEGQYLNDKNRNPLADPTWAPALGPLNSSGTSLKQPYYFGVWSVHVGDDGDLYVGGQFGNVTAGGTTYGKQAKYVAFDAAGSTA